MFVVYCAIQVMSIANFMAYNSHILCTFVAGLLPLPGSDDFQIPHQTLTRVLNDNSLTKRLRNEAIKSIEEKYIIQNIVKKLCFLYKQLA
jgi:hypothetical protein